MRRLGLLALAAGLVLSVLPAVPAVVGAATTITFSVVDASGNAVTSVGEDIGSKVVRLKATVASAPSSNLQISISALSGTATQGATINVNRFDPGRPPRYVCNSGDYCTSEPWNLTIHRNQRSATSTTFTIELRSDRITEEHETIIFSGRASGYTVTPATLSITDQDRAIKVGLRILGGSEGVE